MRIDRYLFKELLKPALLGIAFYTFALLMNQLFLVVNEAFRRGAGPAVVLQLLTLALPKILVLTIPMGLLFGLLLGLGRLSADSEIVALRASGVSPLRMSLPVLLLGLAGTLASFLVYNLASPVASSRIQDLRAAMLRASDPNREIRAGVFYSEIPDTLVYARQVDRSDPVWPLRDVFIRTDRIATSWIGEPPAAGAGEEPDSGAPPGETPGAEPPGGETVPEGGAGTPSSPPQTIICGDRGRIEVSPDARQVEFVIERGEIHIDNPADSRSYQRIPFDSRFVTAIPLAGYEAGAGDRRQSVAEYTIPELLQELDRTRLPKRRPATNPERVRRHRRALLEVHWRFAVPLASFVFCVVGFPLGLSNRRGGKASGFALSLAVIIAYWIALDSGGQLVLLGRLPAAAGAWGPDAILLALAAALVLWRGGKERSLVPEGFRARLSLLQGRLSEGLRRGRSAARTPELPARVFAAPRPRTLLTLLDLYVGRRYLGTFLLVLLSAGSIYAVIEIKDLIDDLFRHPNPLLTALKYLLYFAPGTLKVILPMSCVLAALVTLGILSRSSEVTALKAAGVSIFRIAAPVLAVTALLSALYFVVQDYVTPLTNRRAAEIRDEIEDRISPVSLGGTRWIFGKGRRLYGYADYDEDARVLTGVSVIELKDHPFRMRRRLWSPKITWDDGRWRADSGWRREFRRDREPYEVLHRTFLDWPELPDDFARDERSLVRSGRLAEEMNFVSLRQYVQKMKNSGYDTTRLRVSLYEKLAFPFAPFVMVLLGLPFAFRMGRRGSLYGMGVALGLVIVYWSCFAVASALGHEQVLPPLLAAFGPNLLFALSGSYLMLSTRT